MITTPRVCTTRARCRRCRGARSTAVGHPPRGVFKRSSRALTVPVPSPRLLPRAGTSTSSVSTMSPIRSERYAAATRPLATSRAPSRVSRPAVHPRRPPHRLTSALPPLPAAEQMARREASARGRARHGHRARARARRLLRPAWKRRRRRSRGPRPDPATTLPGPPVDGPPPVPAPAAPAQTADLTWSGPAKTNLEVARAKPEDDPDVWPAPTPREPSPAEARRRRPPPSIARSPRVGAKSLGRRRRRRRQSPRRGSARSSEWTRPRSARVQRGRGRWRNGRGRSGAS